MGIPINGVMGHIICPVIGAVAVDAPPKPQQRVAAPRPAATATPAGELPACDSEEVVRISQRLLNPFGPYAVIKLARKAADDIDGKQWCYAVYQANPGRYLGAGFTIEWTSQAEGRFWVQVRNINPVARPIFRNETKLGNILRFMQPKLACLNVADAKQIHDSNSVPEAKLTSIDADHPAPACIWLNMTTSDRYVADVQGDYSCLSELIGGTNREDKTKPCRWAYMLTEYP
jgi:hypothetical protein